MTKELLSNEQVIETLRLQLAGCGVASLGNTESTVAERIGKDNPYWSASYGSVCDAVDREMKYREQLKALTTLVEKFGKLEAVGEDCEEYERLYNIWKPGTFPNENPSGNG